METNRRTFLIDGFILKFLLSNEDSNLTSPEYPATMNTLILQYEKLS